MTLSKSKTRRLAIAKGFRSGFEERFNHLLTHKQAKGEIKSVEYEQRVITYEKPVTKHKYTPDFVITTLAGTEIYIETKGRFTVEDRKKHVLLKQQRPDLDIRFVFQNANSKLRKGSPTTYAKWCEKNGFLYAHKSIPQEWLSE